MSPLKEEVNEGNRIGEGEADDEAMMQPEKEKKNKKKNKPDRQEQKKKRNDGKTTEEIFSDISNRSTAGMGECVVDWQADLFLSMIRGTQ